MEAPACATPRRAPRRRASPSGARARRGARRARSARSTSPAAVARPSAPTARGGRRHGRARRCASSSRSASNCPRGIAAERQAPFSGSLSVKKTVCHAAWRRSSVTSPSTQIVGSRWSHGRDPAVEARDGEDLAVAVEERLYLHRRIVREAPWVRGDVRKRSVDVRRQRGELHAQARVEARPTSMAGRVWRGDRYLNRTPVGPKRTSGTLKTRRRGEQLTSASPKPQDEPRPEHVDAAATARNILHARRRPECGCVRRSVEFRVGAGQDRSAAGSMPASPLHDDGVARYGADGAIRRSRAPRRAERGEASRGDLHLRKTRRTAASGRVGHGRSRQGARRQPLLRHRPARAGADADRGGAARVRARASTGWRSTRPPRDATSSREAST